MRRPPRLRRGRLAAAAVSIAGSACSTASMAWRWPASRLVRILCGGQMSRPRLDSLALSVWVGWVMAHVSIRRAMPPPARTDRLALAASRVFTGEAMLDDHAVL